MKLSEELKRRIKQLEQEQDRQEHELQDLNELRDLAAITELEIELKRIEEKGVATVQPPAEKTPDMQLAREREVIDQGEQAQQELQAQNPPKTTDDIDLSKEFIGQKASKASVTGGYAIYLMFNPIAPSEWSDESGGGWRGRGLGTHYATLEESKAKLAELKKKWPDYPFKLVKA